MSYSCSNNTDEYVLEQDTSEFFNPPDWIHGKWQVNGTVLFKFTNNDFMTIANGNETSFKYILSLPSNINPNVIENISNTEYNFVISTGIQNHEYKFKKINNNTIQWVNYPQSNIVGAYYLTRY